MLTDTYDMNDKISICLSSIESIVNKLMEHMPEILITDIVTKLVKAIRHISGKQECDVTSLVTGNRSHYNVCHTVFMTSLVLQTLYSNLNECSAPSICGILVDWLLRYVPTAVNKMYYMSFSSIT